MFEEIFGTLQTECGYTPSEINEMTLFDVQRLANHWRHHPPLRSLVRVIAATLGVKFDEPPTTKTQHLNEKEFAALVRATNSGATLVNPNG